MTEDVFFETWLPVFLFWWPLPVAIVGYVLYKLHHRYRLRWGRHTAIRSQPEHRVAGTERPHSQGPLKIPVAGP